MFARRSLLLLVVVATVWSPVARSAELSAERKEKLMWLDQSLQKVVTLYREKKTDEVKTLVGEIDSALSAYQVANEGDATLEPVLAPFRARLAAARKLAEHSPLQVASITPLAKPAAAPVPKPGTNTPPPAVPTPTPSATRPRPGVRPMPNANGEVSFTKEVVPILVAKCGGCHVRGSRGDFSMANYAALMAGTGGTLTVIKPGKGETSILVEKMASGEMPPGGDKVSTPELALISKWIDQGAKYDSQDPSTSLMQFGPDGTVGAMPGAAPLARAAGNEKVLFMRDVAPLLITACFDCHGNLGGNNNSGNFGMSTFTDLMRGGQDGPVVTPGNAEGSVLVKMLRGTAKGLQMEARPRMPRNGQPFDDTRMSVITTWINDGAKFDGEDPQMSIDLAYRIAQAKLATHEELTASRMVLAKKNWATANPDSPAEVIEMTDFLLIGDLGPVRMQEVQKVLQTERTKFAAAFKLPTDKPLLKGRLTVNVFDKSFEHKEYSRVVELRELATGVSAHWGFNYIDAYACVTASKDSADTIAPLLAEVMIGAYLDSLGSEMPRWFAIGTTRNIVSKLHAKSDITKQWEDNLAPAMASPLKAESILNTKNPDSNISAISQAFVKDLMRSPTWAPLMATIAKGGRFDGAFSQAYKGPALPIMVQWLGKR
ncbi:MAG: hypothetical protein K8U03_22365 [Planctomycetia bacterium]|nr:hypothetical protein [Planctomycetia bacterium]